jgi:translation elongation factor EF-G
MTKGTGFYTMEFDDYQVVPDKLKKQIFLKHGFFEE